MSLFPAYSNDKQEVQTSIEAQNQCWLKNSSFTQRIEEENANEDNSQIQSQFNSKKRKDRSSSCSEEDDGICTVKVKPENSKSEYLVVGGSSENDSNSEKISNSHSEKKKKKKKKEKKKYKKNKEKMKIQSIKSSADVTEVPGLFYIDKRREPGNLLVETLHRPAVPLYDRPRKSCYFHKKKSTNKGNSKKYRYYTFAYETSDELYIKEDPNIMEEVTPEGKEVGVNCEKEITEKTRHFNERLELEPTNVNLWLDYMKFQDTLCNYEFSRSFSKNASRKVVAEKKIAILEKAISLNPICEELLKEKLKLAEVVYPPGKLLNEAVDLLSKDKTNLTLCRTVIRCSQFNLARCTTPGVMNAFSDALDRFHQSRMRHLNNQQSETMKSITKLMLVLLLECGLFMRQAGLWEQLLALFKQYLEMNVSTFVDEIHESYKFNIKIDEESIYNTEETILQSNLPLSAIWLRIERLREACYWLPLSNSSEEDKNIDPQRFVFSDDIRYLMQPILPSTLNLHLVVIILYVLKIPLLPSRHMIFEFLRLDEILYAVDAVENLLAVFFPVGLMQIKKDGHFFKDLPDLINGPQYLIDKLGKSEFLSLIGIIFESAGRHLPESETVTLYTLYLRFNRVLISLSQINNCITYDDSYKKRIKKFAKERLKEPQFRNELQLYNEYALLERDFGNNEASLNVLHTAIKFRRFTYEKATYVALYRNIVETLLRSNPNENREKAINVLCNLVSSDNVVIAAEKFKHINTEATSTFLQSVELSKEVELIDLFNPHWFLEWTACYSYFLLLTKSVWAATGVIQESIDSLLPNISTCTVGKFVCEGLYELSVSIIHFYCSETNTSYHVLQDIVQSAHKMYPNNLHFLHTISLVETSAGSAGSPWWKLSSFFTSSNSVLPRLFLVFILRHRISLSLQEGGWSDTSGHNLMNSLLDRLINDEVSKECPLIWRLYLQFLSINKSGSCLKRAFYRSVEECPWVKALYVDAIQFLPENIQEIQDLLIEKELRLHSVMDELDILRNGSV